MEQGRQIGPSARSRPPVDHTPLSALILARKQLDDDTTKTWLLVTLCAFLGFTFSAQLIFQFTGLLFGAGDPFGALGSAAVAMGVTAAVLAGIGLSLLLPALIVIGANRAYKRQYDWITAELVHGDLALMLVDESYGRMIQEWRESRYYARLSGEVHLGETFAQRLYHFGAYAMQYFRLTQGQREFKVTPAAPLNCWLDGILMWCLGGLIWLTVFLPLRVVYTYPRSIATRRAALDFFAGKWEAALNEKYSQREGFRRDPAAMASVRAGSPPPP